MEDNKFSVMIPCAQEDFASFVSGLLGKPQTLERMHVSAFEVNRPGIENLFHLIDQRLKQQNDATLIQFTVRIVYDDDSSVLLNSFEDFLQYVEVRPLVSVSVQLSWTYLIRFQDRKVPEKQQIDVLFKSGRGGAIDLEFSLFEPIPWYERGYVATQVKHTARTWGIDIDSLLEGHIRTLARPVSPARRWTSRHTGKLAVISGLSFLSATAGGAYYSANLFLGQQLYRVQSFLKTEGATPSVSDKLDFLLGLAAEGSWPRFAFMIGGFALFALIASVAFGILVGSTADNKPRSFVVLTDKSEAKRQELLRKEERRWLSFVGSVVSGIAIGVISNVVFSVSLAKWLASQQ